MSIKVMAQVWETEVVSDHTELLLLLAMADFADARRAFDVENIQGLKRVDSQLKALPCSTLMNWSVKDVERSRYAESMSGGRER